MHAKVSIAFFILLFSHNLISQVRILDTVDIESGKYKFYFIDTRLRDEDEIEIILDSEFQYIENKRFSPFKCEVDKGDHFLISDTKEIITLKDKWIGLPTNDMLMCGYDFKIYAVSENKIKYRFNVNTDCGQVVTDYGIFNFEGYPFGEFINKLPMKVASVNTQSLMLSRKFYQQLDPSIIVANPNQPWLTFDGKFNVNLPVRNNTSPIEKFEKKMEKKYSGSEYKTTLWGAGPHKFNLSIYCNKDFYSQYSLTDKGEWESIRPREITFFSEDTTRMNQLIDKTENTTYDFDFKPDSIQSYELILNDSIEDKSFVFRMRVWVHNVLGYRILTEIVYREYYGWDYRRGLLISNKLIVIPKSSIEPDLDQLWTVIDSLDILNLKDHSKAEIFVEKDGKRVKVKDDLFERLISPHSAYRQIELSSPKGIRVYSYPPILFPKNSEMIWIAPEYDRITKFIRALDYEFEYDRPEILKHLKNNWLEERNE